MCDSIVKNYVENLIKDEAVKVTAYARPDLLYTPCYSGMGPTCYMIQLEKAGYVSIEKFRDPEDAMRKESVNTIKRIYDNLTNFHP